MKEDQEVSSVAYNERYPEPLKSDEIHALVRICKDEASTREQVEEARNKIILHNMKVVCKLASNMKSAACIDTEDLMQMGVFVIERCIHRFRFDYGATFITYLYCSIRREFWCVYQRERRRTRKVKTGMRVLANGGGEDFSDGSTPWTFANKVCDVQCVEHARKLMTLLNDRDRWIIEMRLDGLTLKEISEVTGITRERARQIFSRSIVAITIGMEERMGIVHDSTRVRIRSTGDGGVQPQPIPGDEDDGTGVRAGQLFYMPPGACGEGGG